jgi:hypothetical protein
MFDITNINEKLSQLQSSSINCGGTWEARLFDKLETNEDSITTLRRVFKDNPNYDNIIRHQEFVEKGEWSPEQSKLVENLILIELKDW